MDCLNAIAYTHPMCCKYSYGCIRINQYQTKVYFIIAIKTTNGTYQNTINAKLIGKNQGWVCLKEGLKGVLWFGNSDDVIIL